MVAICGCPKAHGSISESPWILWQTIDYWIVWPNHLKGGRVCVCVCLSGCLPACLSASSPPRDENVKDPHVWEQRPFVWSSEHQPWTNTCQWPKPSPSLRASSRNKTHKLGCEICFPAKSFTFSGLMEKQLVGKKLKCPTSKQDAPK